VPQALRETFLDLLCAAPARIASDYFMLSVHDALDMYRERAHC
jgi:hypothetical protein